MHPKHHRHYEGGTCLQSRAKGQQILQTFARGRYCFIQSFARAVRGHLRSGRDIHFTVEHIHYIYDLFAGHLFAEVISGMRIGHIPALNYD